MFFGAYIKRKGFSWIKIGMSFRPPPSEKEPMGFSGGADCGRVVEE